MSLPKIQSLTETDVKILLSLVQKQTLEEVTRTSGVPFSYAQRRLRHLKAKRFIEVVDKTGQAWVYQTCRLPETERLFDIRAVSNSNSNLYHIPYFYGQHLTVGEAFNWIINKNNEVKATQHILSLIKWSIAVLKVRSYRKSIGQLMHDRPTEKQMRDVLWVYIIKTERELTLAKELYNTEFLWSGHENIWRIISEGEPSEAIIKAYNEANKVLG